MNLHIFETDDEGGYVTPEGYKISWADLEYYVESKRLTGPEMAAEYWYSEWMYERAKWTDDPETGVLDEHSYTMHRFRSSPHYDELDNEEGNY